MLGSQITPEEFGQLFIRYKDKYISIACSFTRDRVTAEDIVVECFMNFWNDRDRIELKSLPEAYILQMVRNKCLNHLRDKANHLRIREKYAARVLEAESDILAQERLDFLFEDEVINILREYLARMPKLTRDIFVTSRFEGLTYNEIAEKYKVSPRKVKREIQNVLGQMRIRLKDYLPLLALLFLRY